MKNLEILKSIPNVENMTSSNGNDVPNQFIIKTDKGVFFKSYSTIIAAEIDGKTYLDADKWDYSTTTGKYRNQFLNMDKKETEKAIAAGKIILTDLNKQQVAYGEAQQGLTGAQSLASQMASTILSDQNTKYSTLMDQYNTAATKEQQAQAEKQWWAQFEESRAQFNQTLALQTQQLYAQIASSQASTNALFAQIDAANKAQEKADANAAAEAERQAAIAKQANSDYWVKKSQEANAAAEAANKNKPLSYLESIQQYGPLALFGGGWGWKF